MSGSELGTPIVFETSVLSTEDDAEERSSGSVALRSSDLELSEDGERNQTVGLRFTDIDIPDGAVITSAYIEFQSDEASSGSASLVIRGDDSGDASAFQHERFDLTSRAMTDASVDWSVSEWSTVGESGSAERTPDLSAIVQEISDRSDWSALNDMAFLIAGSGTRTAESFDGESGAAPKLHIEYVLDTSSPGGSSPPSVSVTAPAEDSSLSGVVTISADAWDDGAVDSVLFELDSEPLGAPDTTAPYTLDFDTSLWSDGVVALSAVATDDDGNQTVSSPVTVTIDNSSGEPPPPPPPPSGTVRVPEDFATIQEAVDAAGDGDTVLVGPGVYDGGIVIAGKSITIASYFATTGDPAYIENTIISGGSPILTVADSAPDTVVQGFHFVGGSKGVSFFGENGQALDNFFDNVDSDAISFESVGGVARGNHVLNAGDDAVDSDHASGDILIEGNTFEFSGDDGIEVRNHDYQGSLVTVTIRDNTIVGSERDGIQIIDYPDVSDRMFVIEGNLIRDNGASGLGIMDNGETLEDFRAASMPERVHVFGNTFDGNTYGITGGDDLVAVNNIVSNSTVLGIKGIDGDSAVSHTLFWNNGQDAAGSNVDRSTTLSGDPLYTSGWGLAAGSPAIDAGTASFDHDGETVLDLASSDFSGSSPDLGWTEYLA